MEIAEAVGVEHEQVFISSTYEDLREVRQRCKKQFCRCINSQLEWKCLVQMILNNGR